MLWLPLSEAAPFPKVSCFVFILARFMAKEVFLLARRTVLIQSKAYLSIKRGLLSIETEQGSIKLPLEEIWVVIVESHLTTLTTACLSKLSDAGIGVMICGSDHMPNGLLLPLGAHSRHSAIVDDQLSMTKPLQKQLWRRIIQAKILNQAAVLDEFGIPSASVRQYAKQVLSGDTNNREGAAAALYFQLLIQHGGRRNSVYSPALDYGYSVIRAGIGRSAVGGGWLVSRGIHHHSVYNAFNLVDDLIEPYRPLIDLIVMEYDIADPLDSTSKALLTRAFEYTMLINGKRCSCEQCIETMLSSLRSAVLEKDANKLQLPILDGLQLVSME